jgi:cation transport ATPase
VVADGLLGQEQALRDLRVAQSLGHQREDLTLVSGDLRAAADAIRLSRATLRTIKQNLAWAFGYNVAVIPLAASGVLNPVIASLAMVLSSISVVANALRLRRFAAQRVQPNRRPPAKRWS